jgi:hypothetical protein
MGIGVMGPGSRFAWPGRRIHFSNNQTISNANPRSRGAMRPRFAGNFLTLQSEGAGNTGCTLHPRSRVQQCTKQTHTSIQVQRRQSGIPCAMVLRLISRSPRRSGFLVTVAGGVLTANLTPASRRQDHTTLPSASSAFVKGAIRVHRIPSRVRDDRVSPLFGTGQRWI